MYTRGGKMNGTNEEELQKMGVFLLEDGWKMELKC